MCTCVPSFVFSFFSHHESFILVIASSPFHHNFFSCFCIFVILAFHSITTSFLVFATLLPPHSTPLQFLFLFLQLHYHRIPLHHYFFSCFYNFVTTAFHCHPRMLLSIMDSFKKQFQATRPLSTDTLPNPGVNPLEGSPKCSCGKRDSEGRSRLPTLERGRGSSWEPRD